MAISGNVEIALRSARLLGDQVGAGWKSAAAAARGVVRVENLLVCGMGGSALAADVALSALAKDLRKPVAIERSYDLPGWVGRRTLVVCVSYSGKTAETLSCLRRATAAGAAAVAVATGGPLARGARAAAVYDDRELNPSRQPRLGVGFSLGALLRILGAAGALRNAAAAAAAAGSARAASPTAAALRQLRGRAVAVVGVGGLAGAAHAVANCFNENAKAFSAPFAMPELDHHLLEGLDVPARIGERLAFVWLTTGSLPTQLARQERATLQILRRRKVPVLVHRFDGHPLAAALHAVSWGTQASILVAAATGRDPLAVPWVQWLKQQQRG